MPLLLPLQIPARTGQVGPIVILLYPVKRLQVAFTIFETIIFFLRTGFRCLHLSFYRFAGLMAGLMACFMASSMCSAVASVNFCLFKFFLRTWYHISQFVTLIGHTSILLQLSGRGILTFYD